MLFECEHVDCSNLKIIQDNLGELHLNVLHVNIRSYHKNIDELRILLDKFSDVNLSIDVLCMCETFLNSDNQHLAVISGFNRVLANRENQKGGGVAIYVRDTIELVKTIDTIFVEGILESVTVQLKKSSQKYVISEFYRPPNGNMTTFVDELLKYLEVLKRQNVPTIVCTDQNIDFMKQHSNYSKDVLDIMINYTLTPLITKPTRITHSSCTLIDNIYVDFNKNLHAKSFVIQDDFTDHFPCLVRVIDQRKIGHDEPYMCITKRKFKDEAILALNHDLLHFNWSGLYDMNVNESYSFLSNVIDKLLNIHCPFRSIKISTKNYITEPWVSVKLLKYGRKCKKIVHKSAGL